MFYGDIALPTDDTFVDFVRRRFPHAKQLILKFHVVPERIREYEEPPQIRREVERVDFAMCYLRMHRCDIESAMDTVTPLLESFTVVLHADMGLMDIRTRQPEAIFHREAQGLLEQCLRERARLIGRAGSLKLVQRQLEYPIDGRPPRLITPRNRYRKW
jgi:hypothetical protein